MTTIDSLTHVTDDQLVARVHMLASDERRATVALISTLVEFDARRLYLREAVHPGRRASAGVET
jgi:hypothetical protein